ncbi:hypothetical protein QR680_009341 [Steinernema hermaphroditum]|uniref:Uncharacterized protein n=1 Tax=Steinernema hermaphroditum TaxID=289476 RepID=A0AA39M9R6_9BILA|nr:hypothetical protein QR680_009341 [Steinernema hermaphroditum]
MPYLAQISRAPTPFTPFVFFYSSKMRLPEETLGWALTLSCVLLVAISVSIAVFFVSRRRRELLDARRTTPTSFAPAVSFLPPAVPKAASKTSLDVPEDSTRSSSVDLKNLETRSGLERVL